MERYLEKKDPDKNQTLRRDMMEHLERRMLKLRSHPNLPDLLNTLPFHTREVLFGVLETGANFPLMEKASQCTSDEFYENAILQILANGNVLLLDAVTDVALDEIEYLLETVYDEDSNT
jgi:hypothetical protein